MILNVDPQLSQWDVGRIVSISNSEATHIHFANQGDSKAVIIEIENGSAKIPDYLLQTGKTIIAYAVCDGVTLESKSFSVRKRERPENYIYEEDQRNFIYELITSAENAIEEASTAAENANKATANASDAAVRANEACDSANEAAENANKATENANEAAFKAEHTAKSLMVVGDAEGAVIALDDAIDQYLVGLRVFGKTTQNGTPTPDAPVELVSVGDNGDIGVKVCGLQLANTAESLINPGIISITEQGKRVEVKNKSAYVNAQFPLSLSQNTDYVLSYTTNLVSGQYNAKIIGIDYNGAETSIVVSVATPLTFNSGKYSSWKVAFYSTTELQTNPVFERVMVNIGTSALPWEPYKGQGLAVLTPNGLPGIPVTSGGNYTDANGQQWICDEIDFYRGVYVQRVQQRVLNGTEPWVKNDSDDGNYLYFLRTEGLGGNEVMCDALPKKGADAMNRPGVSADLMGIAINHNIQVIYINICVLMEENSKTELTNILSQRNMEVLYRLATPIETPLSAEELAAYAALHTYKEYTTVSNDAGAYMELEYVMDAKKYIDSLVGGGIAKATVE